MAKKRITRDLTAEEVGSLVSYNPDTGIIRHVTDRGGYRAGEEAGGFKDGYRIVGINCSQYRAHHIAWLLMTGEWPPLDMDIDHIDRNRSNNAWSNLRIASRTQNNMNMSVRGDNKSGYRGVGLRKDTGKWYARLKVDGKLHLLGHFDNFEEAKAVRISAEEKYFGDFAAS